MSAHRNRIATLIASTALALSASCKRDRIDPEDEAARPGALNDGPVVVEVPYSELDYERDGSFTKGGKPFNGRAIQNYADSEKTLKSRYEFIDGRFDGIVEEWHPNGVRSTLKMYKDGMRDGITTYWDEDGEPIKQVKYKEDEEVEEITDPEKLKELGL